ncbi:MAG: DUF2304 domain-containing protein [Clostridia bacterium]|nr:DUF2304 domain-containing protein [Clostridia bacterium]
MITTRMQLFTIAAVLIFFFAIINLIKNRRLLLKYSLLWLFSGLAMLVLAVFPGLLDRFARLLGIYSSVNALFAVLIFCGLVVMISFTVIISRDNQQIVRLAQKTALLEKRIQELEKQAGTLPEDKNTAGNGGEK